MQTVLDPLNIALKVCVSHVRLMLTALDHSFVMGMDIAKSAVMMVIALVQMSVIQEEEVFYVLNVL